VFHEYRDTEREKAVRPSYDEGDGWDFFDYDPKKKVKW
jgi:hypothetical protein